MRRSRRTRWRNSSVPNCVALFQRKKGRDLYDVWYALKNGGDPEKIVACFARYMRESGLDVSRAEFEQNLAGKLEDASFVADITPLLRTEMEWNPRDAASAVYSDLLAKLPGLAWKRPTRDA